MQVGLTGGIGAGKSAVAARLVEHGAVLVDADVLARQVVAPGTPGFERVVAEFGPGVLTAAGDLDRRRLGRVVFADPARLRALNAIVHPLVRQRSADLAMAAPAGSIVVHDVPLLVENRLAAAYDLVVVVDVPPELALHRLRGRGMNETDARARIAAQADRAERLAAADVVLDNAGTPAALERQVDDLWAELQHRAARKAQE